MSHQAGDNSGKSNNQPVEDDHSKFSYNYIEEVEDLTRYEPGGYHPIEIGGTLHNRYRVVNKLGHGTFSTAWLARDTIADRYVAVKICTADSGGKSHEMEILRRLEARATDLGHKHDDRISMIPRLLDEFEVTGPNGMHSCIVTTPTRMSIADAHEVSRCCGLFHLPVARAIIAQLIHAVSFCHENGVVHGDLYLKNVMFRFPPSLNIHDISQDALYEKFGEPAVFPIERSDQGDLEPGVPAHAVQGAWFGTGTENITLEECSISLSDFGEAYLVGPGLLQRMDCHTPLRCRAPEAQFDLSQLGPASDIWSLACAVFELAGGGAHIFYGSFFLTPDSVTEDWVDALGKLPEEWWEKWEARADSFTEDGERLDHSDDDTRGPLKHRFEKRIQEVRRSEGMGEWSEEEKTALLDMLKAMLVYRPAERISISGVLEAEWMRRWGQPAFQKMKKMQQQETSKDP